MDMAGERRRGRPKGTGINDQEVLLKIATLLAANPAKKRTTAIKEVGITNPSIVRRLRDKYQEQEESLLAHVHATSAKTNRKAGPVHVAPAPVQAATGPAAATAARKGKNGAAHPAAQIREETIASAPQPAAASSSPAMDPLAALFEGLNIETLVTQFIGHVLGLDANEIKNSPITALIKQQAQLADLVLPMLAAQFMNQKASKAA
jgi:hypothetical protein